MTTALDERIRQLFDGVAPVTAAEARERAAGRPARPRRATTRTVLVVAASMATLAGVLVAVTARSPGSHRTGPVTATTTPKPGELFTRPFSSPQLTVTGSGAYLSWWTSTPASGARSALAQVDLSNGRFLARRDLGAVSVDQVLAAGSSLWVTVTTSSQAGEEQLLRLDPSTLRLERRFSLAGGGYEGDNLAAAGGGLWADGGDKLFRFSLRSGNLVRTVSLPGAASSTVAAGTPGSSLIVGEADASGVGAVQRRDPVTGGLLASRAVMGVAAPRVAVSGAAVWISQPTGMLGYVQLLSLPRLAPVGPSCPEGASNRTCVDGSNGLRAVIEAGRLFVTDPVGGPTRNYCADPANGRVLAALRLPRPQQDRLLTAFDGVIYYAATAPSGDEYVKRQTMPPACSAGS